MTGMIPIHVKIPTESWGPLTQRAEREGFTSPTAYVQDMVTRFAAVATETERVIFLRSQGAEYKQIAEETGLTVTSVKRRLTWAETWATQ
jgi:DNA invertase Pin-like site-specific DNA recombinase